MAQFTLYRNTDASAPTLTGETDKLCALLQACLVDGYGAKAAAGWTAAFDGASKTAFRQGSGSQFYLRVQDDGPGAGTFKEARITGYETMSDVDTGTGPFPTAAQGVGGVAMLVVRKSVAADSTARDWLVVADDQTVYVFIKSEVAVGVAGVWYAFMFGEIYSVVNSDAYSCSICGRTTENSTSAATSVERMAILQQTVSSAGAGFFTARSYLGTGGSVLMNKTGNANLMGSTAEFIGTLPYPNPSDGGMYVSKVWIGDNTTAPANSVRGWMRGFYQFLHPLVSVADKDTVSGTGDFTGKTFVFVKTAGSNGVYMIETSATVDSN